MYLLLVDDVTDCRFPSGGVCILDHFKQLKKTKWGKIGVKITGVKYWNNWSRGLKVILHLSLLYIFKLVVTANSIYCFLPEPKLSQVLKLLSTLPGQ